MKTIILCGGTGTRLKEETEFKPKPLVQIGNEPILWHIMKIYSTYGIHDFIVCLGYKGYMIKEYFSNYFLHMSDVTFDMKKNAMTVHERHAEPWTVTLVDTGNHTLTGGRLRRIRSFLDDEDFCFTYGDGVGDVNMAALLKLHQQENRLATVTAVQPPGRFGAIEYTDHRVEHFVEKPQGDGGWINGGFFVLSPKVLDYIQDDSTIWEREPMRNLAEDQQMSVYFHEGFWQPMDTLRERQLLEDLWLSGKAPWKMWE